MQLTVLRRVLPLLVLPVLVGSTPLSAPGQTMKAEPDGFDKAKFGMNEQQVKALYPKMQQVVMPTPPPEQAPKDPLPFTLTTYTLDNQSFGPLKPCKIAMRFFQNEFTDVQYDCANKDKVHDYLESQFGPPTSVSPRKAINWTGKRIGVTEMGATHVFRVSDLGRSQKMSYTLLAYAMKLQHQIPWIGQAPEAAAAQTPASTPQAGK